MMAESDSSSDSDAPSDDEPDQVPSTTLNVLLHMKGNLESYSLISTKVLSDTPQDPASPAVDRWRSPGRLVLPEFVPHLEYGSALARRKTRGRRQTGVQSGG
jgi:hypothetical protein